ncbi:MAG TPA: hypothetical protein VLM41_03835 [Steroidobacteraceae bacterium]|nr:hypothetical protein [Steroidobacteraceae bacterium]
MSALAATLLAGCTATPVDPYGPTTPPAVLATLADAGVRDLRAPYREAVCRRLAQHGNDCDDILLRLSGEGTVPAAAASPAAVDLAERYRVVMVPGFFAECFAVLAHTFADVERELGRQGYSVSHMQVPGRRSTAHNAAELARQFSELASDARPIIVFAHSKGLLDTLEFIAGHPAASRQIAAVVSVAGAANGSPLADQLLTSYQRFVAGTPWPGCETGDGAEIDDLRRDVRLEWWYRNRAAIDVPVFSLVAAPRPERVSPGTLSTYRSLAEIDPRNDGKLIWYDQIVPGGYLLGYVNADHWTIAIPVAEELPPLARWFPDEVPRTALAEAAIELIDRTLDADGPR